ncbi:hypothetical protein T261_00335 [Streptomyces lydicus]|nr:hypothetical protein T261_00335 [Streptomyces lydicus]
MGASIAAVTRRQALTVRVDGRTSPKGAQNRYDLSEDTRGTGLREPADAGLVTTKRPAAD